MKKEFKRDLQNNYLILEATDAGTKEAYALRMAEQNEIKNLLRMHSAKRDGICCLYYEITSKQTLESVYEKRKLEYQDILMILSGIRDALEDMRRYLLSAQYLLFSPDLIYVLPARDGVRFCYYPGEHDCTLTLLSEFILKKLDHTDAQAVALGYGLYERVGYENFSLTETLKEILASEEKALGQHDVEISAKLPGPEESRRQEDIWDFDPEDMNGGIPVEHKERKKEKKDREEKNDKTNKEEKGKKNEKKSGRADRFFQTIHPAVLFSFLVLVILLELSLIHAFLSLTEAGGIFFLFLALELLLNRMLLARKTPKELQWAKEEEDPEYDELLDEMYCGEEEGGSEEIEETCCLIPGEEKPKELRLIHISEDSLQERYEDIVPGDKPIYIGKASADADMILKEPTVSRLHARVQKRGDVCYLKDMNSKNGTFVNGRRLLAQEEYELCLNDEIAFADVRYRVSFGSGKNDCQEKE